MVFVVLSSSSSFIAIIIKSFVVVFRLHLLVHCFLNIVHLYKYFTYLLWPLLYLTNIVDFSVSIVVVAAVANVNYKVILNIVAVICIPVVHRNVAIMSAHMCFLWPYRHTRATHNT